MDTSTRRLLQLAGCLIATAALAAGCGGDDEGSSGGGGASAPGVTATTVKIGSHQPLTGPAAPGYSEIAPAAKAFFDHLNAQGGVHGRTIELVFRDDAYNPTNTVNVVRRLVLQDKVFALMGGLGTPTHTKVIDYLNASRIPDLFVASGCPCWSDGAKHPWTFGWQTDYKIEGKILGRHLKEHFAGKKVGVFYQDDDFGQSGLEGLRSQIGDQVVSAQPYQPGNTDVAPQITALRKAGAEVVVHFTIPAYTALAHLVAFKLGYKPQAVIANVGSDPITVGGLLKSFSKGEAGTALIEGAITDGYLPSVYDADDPWTRYFRGIHDKYNAKAPFTGNALYGMAMAYTFSQALEAAGEDPTRQSLVDALEKGGLSGPGLTPFRYSGDDHGGYSGTQMGRIADGKIVLSGDPLVTDPGDGPVVPYTKGHPTPEEAGVTAP